MGWGVYFGVVTSVSQVAYKVYVPTNIGGYYQGGHRTG